MQSVPTAQSQAALTPEQALQLLKDGNRRFVEGAPLLRDWRAQVAASASGQYPHAVVLGCIDSRVPPEIVFDQGIGDMFTPRVAGNFVNTDILGSMEFATQVAGAKAIVVLGHTACGALQGACAGVALGNLTATLRNLEPALASAAHHLPGPHTADNLDYINAAARVNVLQTVQNILARSPVIQRRVKEGLLAVVGAMHDLQTGTVTFL